MKCSPKMVWAVVAMSACSSGGSVPTETGSPSPSGRTFAVAVGEAAPVPGTGVTIAFDSVTEDSRCPLDVNCVWEGNGRVALTLIGPDGWEEAALNTALAPRDVGFAGIRIGLVALDPYPAGVPIDPLDYVATFQIED